MSTEHVQAGGAAGPPPESFDAVLRRHQAAPLRRGVVRTLQINVGKRCNQACQHCHVDAGPTRTEAMARPTAERLMAVLARSPRVETVDLTGGAPELNPNFVFLVEQARALGRRVIVRCNLTVLFTAGMEDLPVFYRRQQVDLVCSLPCYTAENVDRQRGDGVFAQSIEALRRVNGVGFGLPGSPLRLDLVYNPLGPFLPPAQAALEARYRDELRQQFGVEFHRLLTMTNMPISRFADQLRRAGEYDRYLGVLVNHFNPATVEKLMCRSLVSAGWDGVFYDCDFNQMLALPIASNGCGMPRTCWDVDDLGQLEQRPILTDPHCFGCTAGAGSGCSGALR